jgi:hypothetical protein
MDGGDHAALDLEVLVNHLHEQSQAAASTLQLKDLSLQSKCLDHHLHNRGKTVCRAGCSSTNWHIGSQLVVIYAHYNVQDRRLFQGKAAYNFFHPCIDVWHNFIRTQENTGTFQDNIASKIFPWDLFNRFFVRKGDLGRQKQY